MVYFGGLVLLALLVLAIVYLVLSFVFGGGEPQPAFHVTDAFVANAITSLQLFVQEVQHSTLHARDAFRLLALANSPAFPEQPSPGVGLRLWVTCVYFGGWAWQMRQLFPFRAASYSEQQKCKIVCLCLAPIFLLLGYDVPCFLLSVSALALAGI